MSKLGKCVCECHYESQISFPGQELAGRPECYETNKNGSCSEVEIFNEMTVFIRIALSFSKQGRDKRFYLPWVIIYRRWFWSLQSTAAYYCCKIDHFIIIYFSYQWHRKPLALTLRLSLFCRLQVNEVKKAHNTILSSFHSVVSLCINDSPRLRTDFFRIDHKTSS